MPQQADDKGRAEIRAEKGRNPNGGRDIIAGDKAGDDQRDGCGALQADRQKETGNRCGETVADCLPELVAQKIAIGPLDAGAHHARGPEQERDRARQIDEDD